MRQFVSMNTANYSAILSSVLSLQRRIEEMSVDIGERMVARHNTTMRWFTRMEQSVRRIAVQPVVRPVLADLEDGENVSPPRHTKARYNLTKKPKDLYVLWREYEFGVGGGKPAKFLTAVEQGGDKTNYSWRKVFWDMVVSLIVCGHVSDVAVDMMYGAYGRSQSLTQVLVAMQRDKAEGGHPALYKYQTDKKQDSNMTAANCRRREPS